MKKIIICLVALISVVSQSHAICEKLPLPTSRIIEANPGDNLREIVLNAPVGSTVLLNSGVYNVRSCIFMNRDSITIMSKAQHRDSVILDGNQGGLPLDRHNFTDEIIAMRGDGSTVAHLTIRYAMYHAIHSYPSSSSTDHVTGVKMYDLHIYDCGQQLIKVNSNGNTSNLTWVDDGVLECSLIEFQDKSVMEEQSSYFYTGGIDCHGGYNWKIRNNVFRNISNGTKLMEHCVHFWSKARNVLVENNTFINVYRGVGFGMKTSGDGAMERHYDDGVGDSPYYDNIDGIVRNNVLYNEAGTHLETGIELMNVLNAQIYNNTILCESTPFNSIEYRWPNTSATIKNNIFSHNMMPRDGASVDEEANLENAGTGLVVDPANEDFHLKPDASNAVGKGVSISDSLFGKDIDGQKPNTGKFDIGADQISDVGIKGTSNDKPNGSKLYDFKMVKKGVEFKSSQAKDLDIKLYNAKGKAVLKNQKKVNKGNAVIDLSSASIADGFYVLNINGTNESRVLKCFWMNQK